MVEFQKDARIQMRSARVLWRPWARLPRLKNIRDAEGVAPRAASNALRNLDGDPGFANGRDLMTGSGPKTSTLRSIGEGREAGLSLLRPSRLMQRVADRVERVAHLRADHGHRGDDHDRDQAGDERVFDGRRPALVTDEVRQKMHSTAPGSYPLPRSGSCKDLLPLTDRIL